MIALFSHGRNGYSNEEKNIDLIIAAAPYNEKIPIYVEPNENSEIINNFCGQTCLTCNLYNKKTEIINGFIQVELGKNQIGYVKTKNCICDILFLQNIQDEKRKQVCKTALQYLSTSYKDIQCNDLIQKSFLSIGVNYKKDMAATKYNTDQIGEKITEEELQPGDFVFYQNINNKIIDGHIGLYLGQGYVIQATVDEGTEYPVGGVRITKLTFRAKPTGFRAPFSLL